MKFSANWLKEWTGFRDDAESLAAQLTKAGLEVDSVESTLPGFSDVYVARIDSVQAHPDADKLRVCTVDAGERGSQLQVVCGAPNARPGLMSALAVPGARLPGGQKIGVSKLRGVTSAGMLCSAAELGFGEEAGGIMELPADAPPGAPLADYLDLADWLIDVDLTPNRGDCFSIQGIAREVVALGGGQLSPPVESEPVTALQERFPVRVEAADACPRFTGLVIRGLRPDARSPLWMVERLRRSGIRSIHPVVDVTNLVMLELGQPLHSYDLARLQGAIQVRYARQGEKLTLLDEREITLEDDVLVIADDSGAVGLAGIMGGAGTGVSEQTVDVFLECAFFSPACIAGRARRYGLQTDASQRFERGVDPQGQIRAIRRAAALILSIAGGRGGPVSEVVDEKRLPRRHAVLLRRARLGRVLGIDPRELEVDGILSRLGMQVEQSEDGWLVTPPSFRFDIELEVDLIEEVARIHGYDNIAPLTRSGAEALKPASETRVSAQRLRALLVDRGYLEAVTYSFVNEALQHSFLPDVGAIALENPISRDMSVMRGSLWPGLAEAARENLHRQSTRLRLFEMGRDFHFGSGGVEERPVVAGISVGPLAEEQWGLPRRDADFFDIKSDIEAVAGLGGRAAEWRFVAARHPALHPGQSARIELGKLAAGWLGVIHPALADHLEMPPGTVLWELDWQIAAVAAVPEYTPISRFPAVRRDLAVIVEESVSARAVLDTARAAAGRRLADLVLFDVYRGKGIDSGSKSMALGLILQEASRTLTDSDADAVMTSVATRLAEKLGAKIRH